MKTHRIARVRPLALATIVASAALGSAVVATPAAVHATVMLRRSIDELTHSADLVAVVTVQRATASWINGRIYTDVECRIDDAVRGAATAGTTVLVRTPGGVVGDTGQRLEGAPSLAVGERYVLFLRRGVPGTYETVALAQGALPVATVATATTPRVMQAVLTGIELVAPGGTRASTASVVVPPEGIALDALVRAVRALP